MKLSKCIYCGSELKKFNGYHKEYINHKIIIIDNTPLVMCPSCMEEFIPADTMIVINEILTDVSNRSDCNDTIKVNYNDYCNYSKVCS